MIALDGLVAAVAVLASAAPQSAAPKSVAPQGQGPWILTCAMPHGGSGQPGAQQTRVFRIGRSLFQEWQSDQRQFGPNLCLAHSCTRKADRLEGVISSPTLALTVTFDPRANSATWRTQGASGLRATSGACSVKADTAQAAPAGKPPAP